MRKTVDSGSNHYQSQNRLPPERKCAVAILVIIAVIVIGLGALDAAALAMGADSRDGYPDDHTR
jgi:hypothetical protein